MAGWCSYYLRQGETVVDAVKGEIGGPMSNPDGTTVYLAVDEVWCDPEPPGMVADLVLYAAVRVYDGLLERCLEVYAVVVLVKCAGGPALRVKVLDETTDPQGYSKCPATILDTLTPTGDVKALAWRARCRAALHATIDHHTDETAAQDWQAVNPWYGRIVAAGEGGPEASADDEAKYAAWQAAGATMEGVY